MAGSCAQGVGTAGSRELLLAVILLVGACGSPPPEPSKRAFYYWRTTVALSPVELNALARLQIDRLYLRFFDVELGDDGRARPLAKVALAGGATLPASLEVVPVVFLRNQVLRGLDAAAARELAGKIWSEVAARALALDVAPRELQLDCDWTDGTREPYFALLRALRETARSQGVRLTATIRLHQVKYRERTGVPPVERGMLMFYNMGELGPDDGQRAVYDSGAAANYLARLPGYPLPLDVALPIFSWTLQLRSGRVEELLQSADPAELDALPFLVRTGPARFAVSQTAFFHGALLRKGDELKTESLSPAELREAAAQVARFLAPLPFPAVRTVALFDLSQKNLARHDPSSLEEIFAENLCNHGRARCAPLPAERARLRVRP